MSLFKTILASLLALIIISHFSLNLVIEENTYIAKLSDYEVVYETKKEFKLSVQLQNKSHVYLIL